MKSKDRDNLLHIEDKEFGFSEQSIFKFDGDSEQLDNTLFELFEDKKIDDLQVVIKIKDKETGQDRYFSDTITRPKLDRIFEKGEAKGLEGNFIEDYFETKINYANKNKTGSGIANFEIGDIEIKTIHHK